MRINQTLLLGVLALGLGALTTSCQTIGVTPMWLDGAPVADANTTATQTPVVAPATTDAVPATLDEDGQKFRTVWAQQNPGTLPGPGVPLVQPLLDPVVKPVTRTVKPVLGLRTNSKVFERFYEAAASTDQITAQRRWQKFKADHTLPTGDFEDPTTARLCEWAQQELDRANALRQGKPAEARACKRRMISALQKEQ